jgi:hypothetical protein
MVVKALIAYYSYKDVEKAREVHVGKPVLKEIGFALLWRKLLTQKLRCLEEIHFTLVKNLMEKW